MKTKDHDFIEIDYIAKIKDTDTIFDITKEEDAKKFNLYNKEIKYKPLRICLGERQVIQGLDDFLIDKELKKTLKI